MGKRHHSRKGLHHHNDDCLEYECANDDTCQFMACCRRTIYPLTIDNTSMNTRPPQSRTGYHNTRYSSNTGHTRSLVFEVGPVHRHERCIPLVNADRSPFILLMWWHASERVHCNACRRSVQPEYDDDDDDVLLMVVGVCLPNRQMNVSATSGHDIITMPQKMRTTSASC